MGIFTGVTDLELAEAYAEANNGYDSEEAVSEAFDSAVAESVIAQFGEDDEIAMREAFNNWTDSLTKDGDLHISQYNAYCYVGKYD